MKRHMILTLATAFMTVSAAAWAKETAGPFENIKTSPVTVKWQYSSDGGKTFADKPLPGPPAGKDPKHAGSPQYPYVWKGTFDVADPAKAAGLWVRITDEQSDPKSSICNGDIWAASCSSWQDLGYCPTLLDAAVTLNGKEVPIAHGPILQFWLPLIGEIKKGQNTMELRGNVYTFWKDAPAKAIDALMIAAEPQPVDINNGPVLGDFGDGYFTLACRTQMPAELTIVATPIEPAAAAVTAVSTGKLWHRLKIEVPKGTRKISYTASAKIGPHETKRGPYVVTLPGKEYKFVAFGGTEQHVSGADLLRFQTQLVLEKAKPDFVVNTGNLVEHLAWSFQVEAAYTRPAAELLARVPTLITPCRRDQTGIFDELHYTPAPDGFLHNWTKVIGPVRFIGIDGNMAWASGNPNAQWLESVLKEAKDKFIVVLAGYPAYSSGIDSKKIFGNRQEMRDVVMPLLGKYKATVMLSSWDPTYERIEPTPDKGVTQIVTGCFGQGNWHRWDTRFGSHPYGPGPSGNARGTVGKVTRPDGGEWVGYFGQRHFCVFTVKDDSLEMKVFGTGMPAADAKDKGDARELKDMKVLDQKTFLARQ